MRIQDVMRHPLVTAPVNSSVAVTARLMSEFDCGVVPIVKEDGRLAGTITDRDICMAAYTQDKPLSQIAVASAMEKGVIACQVNDTIEDAERLMRDNQIHCIVILDRATRPIGLVSVDDIARLAMRTKRSSFNREGAETSAAVGQPRTASQEAAARTWPTTAWVVTRPFVRWAAVREWARKAKRPRVAR